MSRLTAQSDYSIVVPCPDSQPSQTILLWCLVPTHSPVRLLRCGALSRLTAQSDYSVVVRCPDSQPSQTTPLWCLVPTHSPVRLLRCGALSRLTAQSDYSVVEFSSFESWKAKTLWFYYAVEDCLLLSLGSSQELSSSWFLSYAVEDCLLLSLGSSQWFFLKLLWFFHKLLETFSSKWYFLKLLHITQASSTAPRSKREKGFKMYVSSHIDNYEELFLILDRRCTGVSLMNHNERLDYVHADRYVNCTEHHVNVTKDCNGVMADCYANGSSSVMSPAFVLAEMTDKSVSGGTVVSTKRNTLILLVMDGRWSSGQQDWESLVRRVTEQVQRLFTEQVQRLFTEQSQSSVIWGIYVYLLRPSRAFRSDLLPPEQEPYQRMEHQSETVSTEDGAPV
ncbi:hypothetical protein NFI96_006217 [Prochilodus magdalenae]|nr:hypothetical protein NFI96_006217 [Prochilodus magdalenae]